MAIVSAKKRVSLRKQFLFPRTFPEQLNVLIEKNKEVTYDTVLASGEIFEDSEKVDVASRLDIEPQEVKKYLKCISGERIEKGDVIAQRKTKVLRKEYIVRASIGGVVSLKEIDSGFVIISDASKETVFYAGMNGVIESILRGKMVQIKTDALVLEISFVEGKTAQGELYFFSEKQKRIENNVEGCIIVPDFEVSVEYLRNLVSLGVNGVILSSLRSDIFLDWEQKGLFDLSLGIVGGFGNIAFDRDIIDIFKQNDGHVCMMDSKNSELIMTNADGFEDEVKKEKFFKLLEVGDNVQTFSSDIWGHFGIVEKIIGNHAYVRLKKPFLHRRVEVPFEDLQVLI